MSPRTTETTRSTICTKLVDSRYANIRTDTLKDKRIKIPMSARIHPQGLRDINTLAATNKIPSLAMVVGGIFTLLRSKDQANIVEASYADIAEVSKVSIRTVTSCIDLLIKKEFLAREGKQKYYISPKLAWFGNQVDWGVALLKLDPDYEVVDERKVS